MRGAQVAMAVVVAAAGVAWTEVTVYRAEGGAGSCGGGFLATPVLSDMVCAMKCARNALCGGFSFVEGVATSHGMCRLHENLIPPDGDLRGTCFVLDPTATATATTAAVPTASTNTASTISASSTVAATVTAPAISVSATTAPATPASTTTTPVTSTVLLSVASVWNLNDASLVMVSGNCDSGSGVVGLSIEGEWFHIHRLLCLSPPAELAFTTPATTEKCTFPNIRDCMTKACPNGTIYMGPKATWTGKLDSCSAGFTSAVATLDNTDCHDVEGDLQPKPAVATSSWVQWRYCEGSSTAFYVVTEAVVTAVSEILSNLTSIKCCRVKPL